MGGKSSGGGGGSLPSTAQLDYHEIHHAVGATRRMIHGTIMKFQVMPTTSLLAGTAAVVCQYVLSHCGNASAPSSLLEPMRTHAHTLLICIGVGTKNACDDTVGITNEPNTIKSKKDALFLYRMQSTALNRKTGRCGQEAEILKKCSDASIKVVGEREVISGWSAIPSCCREKKCLAYVRVCGALRISGEKKRRRIS